MCIWSLIVQDIITHGHLAVNSMKLRRYLSPDLLTSKQPELRRWNRSRDFAFNELISQHYSQQAVHHIRQSSLIQQTLFKKRCRLLAKVFLMSYRNWQFFLMNKRNCTSPSQHMSRLFSRSYFPTHFTTRRSRSIILDKFFCWKQKSAEFQNFWQKFSQRLIRTDKIFPWV